MSEYLLSNNAANIDSALTRVISADTSPTNASLNMVTSGGVKAAIDAIGSGSTAIITTDSFTNAALENSDDGLTSTDTAVPTSKAVVDYVGDTVFTAANSSTLSTVARQQNVWYTATTGTTLAPGGYQIRVNYQYSGDYYAYAGLANNGRIEILIGGNTFKAQNVTTTSGFVSYSPTGYEFEYLPSGGELSYRIRNENGTFNSSTGKIRNVSFTCIRVARI